MKAPLKFFGRRVGCEDQVGCGCVTSRLCPEEACPAVSAAPCGFSPFVTTRLCPDEVRSAVPSCAYLLTAVSSI